MLKPQPGFTANYGLDPNAIQAQEVLSISISAICT